MGKASVMTSGWGARIGASELASALGLEAEAEALLRQAGDLRARFDRSFWCDDLGTYALALDGEKHPCRVRSSNAGHCLWTGIAEAIRAARVVQALLARIRSPTLASAPWRRARPATTRCRVTTDRSGPTAMP